MTFGNKRRAFLKKSGASLGLVAGRSFFRALIGADAVRVAYASDAEGVLDSLCNTNVQTAIGLGDQLAGIVDQHGGVHSRLASVHFELEGEKSNWRETRSTQSLEGGYLPIVSTEARARGGSARWHAYSSTVPHHGADWVTLLETDVPLMAKLWLPFTTEIDMRGGILSSGGQALALLPERVRAQISLAKYNLLTPRRHTWSLSRSPWAPRFVSPLRQKLAAFDRAFTSGRASFLDHPLRYRFPVHAGRVYHVVVGLLRPATADLPSDGPDPAQSLIRVTVDKVSKTVDMDNLTPNEPYVHEFIVTPQSSELHVISETDPSSTSPYRPALLNGIWIFIDHVDVDQVKSGALNDKALFYIRCGEEPLADSACSVTFDARDLIANALATPIILPYHLRVVEAAKLVPARNRSQARAVARQEVGHYWDSFLAKGALFETGDAHLDGLYKTSLINLMLLRQRCPGMGSNGEDLYIVKPGATIYDAFWYRDASYITGALDVAGHLDEAEKSLRLFWQTGLAGKFQSLGQQPSGSWQAPLGEYDGQGQALWALLHHYRLSGDKKWLETVYPSIRRGASWIREVTTLSQFTTEDGDRPVYYGLLPSGLGEAIGAGYNYYHDYWAVLGIRLAATAAHALGREEDATWMSSTYETLSANLHQSIRKSFEGIGQGTYIPATPFNTITQYDIWGTIAALYPTRFLAPHDPMITSTLDLMMRHSREDLYTYFTKKKVWTYITVDWAMCYLLRNEPELFMKLFDGFVAHASTTNCWIEEIFLRSRLGTGDMPHGWAAAQYVHIHRNSLVYEDEGTLHLCWGAKGQWMENGIRVSRAPTEFGVLDFSLALRGDELTLTYDLRHELNKAQPRQILLHLPPSPFRLESISVNQKLMRVSKKDRTVVLE